MSKKLSAKEIDKIKLLLSKGLSHEEISTITERSKRTIGRVSNGKYDVKVVEVKKQESNDIKNLDTLYNALWTALEIVDKFRGNKNA